MVDSVPCRVDPISGDMTSGVIDHNARIKLPPIYEGPHQCGLASQDRPP